MNLTEAEMATPELWLEFAQTDLDAAALIVNWDRMSGIVGFHAQQAAEKAVKGYLIWPGCRNIPRTHDLERLAELVIAQGAVAPPHRALSALTSHAVAPRYPTVEPPTPDEARYALRLAWDVVAFVRNITGISLPPNGTLADPETTETTP